MRFFKSKLILAISIFNLLFCHHSFAETVNSFSIKGSQRVERETILSYLDIKKGQNVTKEDIDKSLKNLYATNLFADVSVSISNGILVIELKENPMVNNIYFEGNKRVKDSDLLPSLSLKTRSIFTASKIQNDTNRIITIYGKQGRYAVRVVPKIIQKSNNRVDVVYEIDEGPKTPVKKIIFVGNENVKDSELKSVLVTKEEGLFSFLTGSGRYEPEIVEFDKETLRKFYNSIGYADFKVLSAYTEFSPSKDAAYVTFVIEEGLVYKFGEISIHNNIKNVNVEDLKKEILTKTGKTFDGDKVEDSIDAITKKLNDMGYAFVNISSNSTIDSANKIIHLNYEVLETTKFYVNKINIEGNVRTHDKVIRRQFRFDEGDAFNATKMKRSEQRLRNLDYFEDVKIDNSQNPNSSDKIDVNVKVTEKSTSQIKVGGGYSSVEGFIVSVGSSETNLFGTGRVLSLGAEKGKRKLDINAGIFDPHIFDSDFGLGFDVDFNKSNRSSYRPYDKKHQSSSIRVSHALNEFLAHEVDYSLSHNEIMNLSSNASNHIKRQAGTRNTSKIAHYFKYDRRDGRFKTTTGYYVNFGQEFAGLGGNTKHVKHTVEGKYYIPIHKDSVILKVSASAGHLKSLKKQDLVFNPNFFFLGGDSLRGFDFGGIGPRDKIIGASGKTGDPLGGNFYYGSSAELNFPVGLPKEYDIYGLTFVDIGSVTNLNLPADQKDTIHNDRKLRASAGFGTVWLTNAGVISLNWGFPFMKQKYDVQRKFTFNFSTNF